MLDLIPHVLIFRPEKLDLILSFVKPPLKLIFFASYNRYLVLHISKLKNLFLKLLLASHELLGLLVKVRLHLIKAGVEAGDRLFEIHNLLVFAQEVPLVITYVIHKNSFVRLLILFIFGRIL